MSIGIALAAFFYVVLFWTLSAWRPRYGLLLILAVSPFQNDISGGGPLRFSLAEINLLLSLPVMLFYVARLRVGPSFLPALIYLTLGFVCTIPNWRESTATSLIQSAIYLIVVVTVFASLTRDEKDCRGAFDAFLLVACFLACAVVTRGSGFLWGLHKNGMGATLATAFIIAFEFWLAERRPRWGFIYMMASAILAAGCLITLSRGAWLAAIAGVFIIFGMRRQLVLMSKTAAVLVPIVAVGWFMLPQESREYATGFEGDRENIRLRYESIDFAMEHFQASPIIGGGVGLRKEFDATNFVFVTMAESGVVGLVAMVLLFGMVGRFLWRLHRQLPRDGLPHSIVVIAFALTFAKLAHGMVDHYWTRGSLTVVWASVGMAVFIDSEVRRLRRSAELTRKIPEKSLEMAASVIPQQIRASASAPCA